MKLYSKGFFPSTAVNTLMLVMVVGLMISCCFVVATTSSTNIDNNTKEQTSTKLTKHDLKLLRILTRLSRGNLLKEMKEKFNHDNTILADFNFANGMKRILPHMKMIVKTIVIGNNMTEPIVKVQRKEFNGEMKKYLTKSIFDQFKNVFGNFVKDLSTDVNFSIPEKLMWKQFLKISRRAHKQFVKGKWDHSLKEINDKDTLYWRQVLEMMKDSKKNNTNESSSATSHEFKTVDEKQYWRDVLKMMKEFKKDSKQPVVDTKKEEDKNYWRQVKEMMKEFRKPKVVSNEDVKYWRKVSSLIKSFGESKQMKKPNELKESDRTYWLSVKKMIKENFDTPKNVTTSQDIAYWRQIHKMIKDMSSKRKLDQDRDFITKPFDRKLKLWTPSQRILNNKQKKMMKPALKMATLISLQSSGNSTKEISKNLKHVLYNVVPYLKDQIRKSRDLNLFQVTPLIREGIKDMIVRDTKLIGGDFKKNIWSLISKLDQHISKNPNLFKLDELKLPTKMFKHMNKALKSVEKIDDFDILADSL